MITEFGRLLRIIRINCGDSARDMARKLMLSPSYLSAIENGKRNVPQDMENLLLDAYPLSDTDRTNLKKAIVQSSDTIKINLTEYAEKKQRLIMALVRDDMEPEKIDQMVRVLDGEEV